MTYKQQLERRKKIAAAVKAGTSVDETAALFHVCVGTVLLACRSQNVVCQRKRPTKTHTLEIVADLKFTCDTQRTIAERWSVNQKTVSSIKIEAERLRLLQNGEQR